MEDAPQSSDVDKEKQTHHVLHQFEKVGQALGYSQDSQDALRHSAATVESMMLERAENEVKWTLGHRAKPETTTQEKFRRIVLSVPVLLTVAVFVIWDMTLLVYALAVYGWDSDESTTAIDVMTWIIVSVFMIELGCRLVAFGTTFFVKNYGLDCLDGVVILASFILLIVGETGAGKSIRIVRILRIIRLVRVISVLCQLRNDLPVGARQLTGENKKRFQDVKHGFDLDLTYIALQPSPLIAMSVPAVGCIQLFRNPISEVARFFRTYHPQKFRIYNACPELPYPSKPFGGDEFVHCFDIQDHTPPRFVDFIAMLRDADSFARGHDDHVIVCHCRGGKGRTGSLACAWLIFSRRCDSGVNALGYFAEARSDMRWSRKLQGVDTPSQKRYVVCLDRLLTINNSYIDTPPENLQPPPETEISLHSLTLMDFLATPAKHQLVAVVTEAGDGGLNWATLVESAPIDGKAANNALFDLQGVTAKGDIRVSVYDKKKRDEAAKKNAGKVEKRIVAGKEPGVLFYFILHTAFLDNESGIKDVGLDMMDKAWKDKKQQYEPHGKVRLSFSSNGHSLGDPFDSKPIPEGAYAGARPGVVDNDLGKHPSKRPADFHSLANALLKITCPPRTDYLDIDHNRLCCDAHLTSTSAPAGIWE